MKIGQKTLLLILVALFVSGCSLFNGSPVSDQTTQATDQAERYFANGFSAIVPKSWTVVETVDDTTVFKASNSANTIYFFVLKYPRNENLISPLDTLNSVFQNPGNLVDYPNFRVLQAPKEVIVDGRLGAFGISSSDIVSSSGEAINTTEHNIIVFSDLDDFQFIFQAKSEYFEEENALFEEFMKSIKFE